MHLSYMRTLSIELFLMQLKAAPCNSTCVLLLNGDVELNDQGAEGTAAERERAYRQKCRRETNAGHFIMRPDVTLQFSGLSVRCRLESV